MATFLASAPAPAPKRAAAFPRSDIKIQIKDHYSSKVYTSGSSLSGEVHITTRRDVPFDAIQILLIGHTKTSFEGMSVPQAITHTFLKMSMPVPDSLYPSPRVLENGKTYTIPFHFVIPRHLTLSACNHDRLKPQLQEHHLLLPPSLGGWHHRDDMSPRMAKVEYTIKARVVRDDPVPPPANAQSGEQPTTKRIRIMEATHNIQVLPATPEDPPLSITPADKLYKMSKTKTLRKRLLTTKLGTITAEASQPAAAVVSSDGRQVVSTPTAHVKFTFTPSTSSNSSKKGVLLPIVTGVSAKIAAYTYFSSGTISDFPDLGEGFIQPYVFDRRGVYSTAVPLRGVEVGEQPVWSTTSTSSGPSTPEQAQPGLVRRDSGYCSSRCSDSSSSFGSGFRAKRKPKTPTAIPGPSTTMAKTQTTTLSIPLPLPTDRKLFVPTFHSCIASRVYTVQLSVSISVSGASTTLNLSLPLQVCVEGFLPAWETPSAPLPILDGAPAEGPQNGSRETVTDGTCSEGCGTTPLGISAPCQGGIMLPPSFEEAEADEYLRPRVWRVPEGLPTDEERRERAQEMGGLPGYGGLFGLHGMGNQEGRERTQADGDGLPGYAGLFGRRVDLMS